MCLRLRHWRETTSSQPRAPSACLFVYVSVDDGDVRRGQALKAYKANLKAKKEAAEKLEEQAAEEQRQAVKEFKAAQEAKAAAAKVKAEQKAQKTRQAVKEVEVCYFFAARRHEACRAMRLTEQGGAGGRRSTWGHHSECRLYADSLRMPRWRPLSSMSDGVSVLVMGKVDWHHGSNGDVRASVSDEQQHRCEGACVVVAGLM